MTRRESNIIIDYVDIFRVQKMIIENPDWHVKVYDPMLIEEYKEALNRSYIPEFRFEEAANLLRQQNDKMPYLKEKYDYPIKHNHEPLTFSFFLKVKTTFKAKPVEIKDALTPPIPFKLDRSEEEDTKRLLEQAKIQPDFWDPAFEWFCVEDFQCSMCNNRIYEPNYFVDFKQRCSHENENHVDISIGEHLYCSICARQAPVSQLLELRYSKYIDILLRERIQENLARNQLSELSKQFANILCADNCIPLILHDAFVKEINYLAECSKYDLHPTSDGKVMNLIHPSMFPYMIDPKAHLKKNGHSEGFTSNYQWLPTDVKVDKEGNCQFLSYINNLYPEVYPNLYPLMEMILNRFIPLFEKCLNMQLRNRQLQVIVEAADYILAPGQSYQGQWHLDGTRQEHILATGIYYYEVDKKLQDNGLAFRRETYREDWPYSYNCAREWCQRKIGPFFAHYYQSEMGIDKVIDQAVFHRGEIYVNRGNFAYTQTYDNATTVNIGHADTPEGRCLVFPNEIQHKVINIYAPSSSSHQQLKRRSLCFYLVDPNYSITSSLSVLPQQKVYYTNMYTEFLEKINIHGIALPFDIIQNIVHYIPTGISLKEALEHRLRFMIDRLKISRDRNLEFEFNYFIWEGAFD